MFLICDMYCISSHWSLAFYFFLIWCFYSFFLWIDHLHLQRCSIFPSQLSCWWKAIWQYRLEEKSLCLISLASKVNPFACFIHSSIMALFSYTATITEPRADPGYQGCKMRQQKIPWNDYKARPTELSGNTFSTNWDYVFSSDWLAEVILWGRLLF